MRIYQNVVPFVALILLAGAMACSSDDHDASMDGAHAGTSGMDGHGEGGTMDHAAGSGGQKPSAGAGGAAGGAVATKDPTTTAIAGIDFDALFVVNGSDNSVTVVNTETNEVAGTIKLQNAEYPHHIYLSADRERLALAVPGMDLSGGHGANPHASHGGGASMPGIVMLLDAKTGATLKARELPAMNHNAAFAPSGTEIWTTQMTDPGKVVALDATTLADVRSVDVGMGPAEVTFSGDAAGARAFVANTGSDSVSVVDVATGDVVKTIPVGKTPVGAWQAGNGMAYVDNEGGKTLSAIDTETLEVKLTYKLGFTPAYAALAPTGMLWVTDTDGGRVVLYMTSMDMKHGAIATGAGAHAIAFAGDKLGYVTNQEEDSLSVIDLGTDEVIKTIPVGKKPNGMVWRKK